MTRLDVTVLLTHLDDSRGLRAVASVAEGSHRPIEVLVADGGSSPEQLEAYRRLGGSLGFPVRVLDAPGTVAETRAQAWPACEGRLIAFLDADEVATPAWLDRLTRPLREGKADFTAGPTRPLSQATPWERYHARMDAWFYRNFVAHDVVYAPMGNTAWRRDIFQSLRERDGYAFDRRFGRGGEDFDLNVRALKAGFRGSYVPYAVLQHDYARLQGYRRVLRKKRNYAIAEYEVRHRHAAFMKERPSLPPREPKPWSKVDILEPFVRRWAWFVARRRFRASRPPE